MSRTTKIWLLIPGAFFVSLVTAPVYAFNEPDGFMGLKFGKPVSEGSLPNCESIRPPLKPGANLDSTIQQLLALHEEQKRKAGEELKRMQELYQQGKAARAEVTHAERALSEAILRVDEDKRWTADTESVLEHTVGTSKPCWNNLGTDGNSHAIKNVALGGFLMDITAESIDGKLAHLFMVFFQADYGKIFLTFKERYGAPTSIKTETLQNGFGAKFKNEILKWEGKHLTIIVDKMGFGVNKGTINYDTDLWRAHSALKFRQDIKDKAKGL